ncbi:MAG: class I SAM-dependent methyltransferase [Clostridiaceae bacterium]|nr:class I SAM-dependent methyltransferase [Clostridiaceae bacterium]
MTHYFSAKPETPSEKSRIETRIRGIDFRFMTDTQVFSKRHVDFGTRLMLESAITELLARGIGRGRLLDLGCGYGVVGIAMKRVFPAMEVVMTDINERAVALSRENMKLNRCEFVSVIVSDGFSSIEGDFDVILTNPPVRAGKKTVFSFFDDSYSHLKEGGRLYTVLQKKQGAPSAYKKLQELFGSCEVIYKDSGYHIMRAIRSSGQSDASGASRSFEKNKRMNREEEWSE